MLQYDEVYELIEQSEKFFANQKYDKAKEILEYLLGIHGELLDSVTNCYTRVLYVEALMALGCSDKKQIISNLDIANQMCEEIADCQVKAELSICICLDYSKYYLDNNLKEFSEEYVLKAVRLCLDNNDPRYISSAIHNLAFFLRELNLYEDNKNGLQVYSHLIREIIEFECEDIDRSDLVILFLKMSEIAFGNRNIEQGRLIFRRAFELEKSFNKRCDIIHDYVLRIGYIIADFLDSELLKEVVIYISHNVLEYINDITKIDDERLVYNACTEISGILRYFISYVYLGVITCDDLEYLEVITNLKNIYSYVLRLRKLGTEGISEIKWMTSEDVVKKIPSNAVYIDYIQFPAILREERILGDLAFSCFSVKKTEKGICLTRHDAFYLLQERTLHLLLNALTRTDREVEVLTSFINKDNMLSKKMYDLLLSPVLNEIEECIDKVYISPDVELNCVPFAMLLDDTGFVIDRFKIAYIDSLRNYAGEINCKNIERNNAVIVGYPKYTVDRMHIREDGIASLQPLPLSKVEAEIVSEKLGVEPIVKEEASKYIFKDVKGQILHVATHGELAEIKEEEEGIVFPLSRCRMFFAGANDYLCSNVTSTTWGNGIMTAEELLRYDLSSVKMGVLSICFSGNGQVDYSQGILGFKTVLLANGVNIIISSLWEVNDFASAVFFSEFYRHIDNWSPVEALRRSQIYVRDVTILELKNAGWFEAKRVRKLGLVANHMKEIANMNEKTRLFERPKYWAGFVITIQ